MLHRKKRRYTKEQKQERVSRKQFAEWLEKHEWVIDEPFDLGEDMVIRIYDDGRWSGITFWAQLKSTTDLASHLIRGNQLSYPIKTKDLLHWRDVATPVYLFLWDVTQETGCWVSVDQAVNELAMRQPDWEKKKTVQVHIPRANTTTTQQLYRIRQSLAQHYLPAVAQNRDLTIHAEFVFTADDEGQAALACFQNHVATGETVTISGKYIKTLDFSEWWTRLVGLPELSESRLIIGPRRAERVVPVRLSVVQEPGDEVALNYIELHELQSGTDEVTLSNESQECPITMRLIMRHSSRTITVNYRLNTKQAYVPSVDEAVQFIHALSRGGSLKLTNLQQNRSFQFGMSASQSSSLDPIFMEIIHKLHVIARRTGVELILSDGWLLDEADLRTVREVFDIVTTGRRTGTGTINIELVNYDHSQIEALAASDEPQHLRLISPESHADLLGTEIPLGPRTTTINGPVSFLAPPDSDADHEVMRIRVEASEIVDEFEKWLPSEDAARS